MSQKGIIDAANVFSAMQKAHIRLKELSVSQGHTEAARQDLLLAELFRDAGNAVKNRFARIVVMHT